MIDDLRLLLPSLLVCRVERILWEVFDLSLPFCGFTSLVDNRVTPPMPVLSPVAVV